MTDYATSRDAAYAGRIQTAIEDFASQFEFLSESSAIIREGMARRWGLGGRSSSRNAARGRRYRTEVCRS